MPWMIPAAIIGSAIIGGGAAMLGASKQSKAANNAAEMQATATSQSTALQERMWNDQKALYQDSLARAQPGVDAGNTALATLLAAYGLPFPQSLSGAIQPRAAAPAPTSNAYATATTQAAPAAQAPQNAYVDAAAYGAANTDLQQEWQRIAGRDPRFGNDANAYYAWHADAKGRSEGRDIPMVQPQASAPAVSNEQATTAAAPAAPAFTPNAAASALPRNVYVPQSAAEQIAAGTAPKSAAEMIAAGQAPRTAAQAIASGAGPQTSAQIIAGLKPGQFVDLYPGLDMNFKESPDYKWRLDQGLDAVDTRNSASFLMKSGAAMKSLNDYAQGAASQEYGNWWNRQTTGYENWNNRNRAASNDFYDQSRTTYNDWFDQTRAGYNDWYDRAETSTANAFNRQGAERNNYLSGLAGIANVGQSANQQANQVSTNLGTAGINYAGNVSNLLTANAGAQGAAGIGSANAWAQGIGGVAGTASGLLMNYANGGFNQPNYNLLPQNAYALSLAGGGGFTGPTSLPAMQPQAVPTYY